MNLIIIDDEPLQHFIMERMLSLYSNSVDHITYSSNAIEILKFLEANRNNADELPDIIFLDLNMPVMNGWDFLDSYKRLQQKVTKSITIYVVSSSIDPGDILRSKKYLSVKDYIIKPMTKLALKKIFDGDSSSEMMPN